MRLDQVILRGTFAARPAASTLPNGSLYATTDTNVVYEVVAAAWTTFVTGGGGGGTPGGSDKNVQYNNATAFGGIANNATATKKYLQQVSSATPSFEQVAAADVSGLAASATTDTTIASNITSGTLPLARIADAEITKVKIENVATSKLLGHGDGAAGAPQEITLGSGLAMTGTTLSSTGGGGAALTVEEIDGTPTVANVVKIKVSNGTLADNGSGIVTVTTNGGGVGSAWSVLTNGDPASPALVFDSAGDAMETEICGGSSCT